MVRDYHNHQIKKTGKGQFYQRKIFGPSDDRLSILRPSVVVVVDEDRPGDRAGCGNFELRSSSHFSRVSGYAAAILGPLSTVCLLAGCLNKNIREGKTPAVNACPAPIKPDHPSQAPSQAPDTTNPTRRFPSQTSESRSTRSPPPGALIQLPCLVQPPSRPSLWPVPLLGLEYHTVGMARVWSFSRPSLYRGFPNQAGVGS